MERVQLNQLEKELVCKYQDLWNNNPPPASVFPIPPAIPAIGNAESKRILSLASCEIISNKDFRKLESDHNNCGFEHVASRSRSILNNELNYFPYRHISPFNDGSQFIITWFALAHINKTLSNDISIFSEQICTGNALKFSLFRDDGDKNRDPKSPSDAKLSMPYIIEDLRIIAPEIIIMPKTRFMLYGGNDEWVNILSKANVTHKVRFLFIQQAVRQNINRFQGDALNIDCSKIDEWIDNSPPQCKKRFKGHLAYLKKNWGTPGSEWTLEI